MFKKIWNAIISFFKKIIDWIIKEIKLNDRLKPRLQSPEDRILLMTNRNEVSGQLDIFEGTIPNDLHGVFYSVYPAGSVNSRGLPFPEQINGTYNKEYGTPIMNGDGMIISVRFNGTQAPVFTSSLMKTPCYFADLHSRQGTNEYGFFGFENFGITRMSLFMGSRNLLNTAAIPVKFSDSNPFLLATYDVGRPFIMDPASLKLKTPVGGHDDWVIGTPPEVPWAFQLVQTTAHPSFDPDTEEVFTVNYSQMSDGKAYVCNPKTIYYLRKDPEKFKEKLAALCRGMVKEMNNEAVKERLKDFFDNLDYYVGDSKIKTEGHKATVEPSVWLMRWKGKQQIEKWVLTDQSGNRLLISECMHQTALTRDFIVLTDCAFKFSYDLLVNNPFPDDPFIDGFLRKHLAGTMQPYTDCYIVKRSSLAAGGGAATAFKLKAPIPVETIHYSCDYENPEGKITLYGIHNTAACVAEWIRSYDLSKLTGEPVSNSMISLFALGSMDINRIGKWVIDVNALQIDETNSKQYYDTGKTDEPDIGPNTWTLGLYTFRDMISPTKTVAQIKCLWYVANGLDSRMLTEFIYNLYTDYKNRIVPVEQILRLTSQDLPQTLVRLNCQTMQPDDHYQFQKNVFIRSLHFIPRPQPSAGIAYELDGHIFCTMQAGMPQAAPTAYRSEYWVFDAARIAEGPVCKFKFDGIQFCFTLHSAWLEQALPFNLDYDVDVQKDYNAVIDRLIDGGVMKDFFNNYVYKDWYAQKTP